MRDGSPIIRCQRDLLAAAAGCEETKKMDEERDRGSKRAK